MTPKISIIVPTFNREQTLQRTLDSLLAQTDHSWECLLVDDGSTDQTVEVIEKMVSRDDRFRRFKRADYPSRSKGANSCRNIGAENARAELLLFLDSDDVLVPTCIEQRWQASREFPSEDLWVFTTYMQNPAKSIARDFNCDPPSADRLGYLQLFATDQVPWCISSSLWRRSAFLELGGFRESLLRHQDAELHTRALVKDIRFKRIHGAYDNIYIFGDEHRKRDHAWTQFRFTQTMVYINLLGERFEKYGWLQGVRSDWRYYFYSIHKNIFCYAPNEFQQERKALAELSRKYSVLGVSDRFRFALMAFVTRWAMLLRFNPKKIVGWLGRPYENRLRYLQGRSNQE